MTFKKITAYIAAAALTVTALFSLSSCRDSEDGGEGKKGLNGWFTSVITGSPATLDPQTCTGDDAEQIIANVFRGLYRRDDGGKVVPAMAESVSVSDDGLVYTFGLSENVMWYGKNDFSAECTAEDFVFAFRRLVDPAMRSERAAEYYCIKNAKEINTGKLTDLTLLGVEAGG
ncbi:MAG: peptide ABC transporter substrate-binding protein, partial [Ruminiclostridium sp.]|nr:peptide ABC transporter substrate-binding protein [Ruminiclostridium sp.]